MLPHTPSQGYQPTFVCNSIGNLDGELYEACKCKNIEEIEKILMIKSEKKKTYYKFLTLMFGKTRDISCDAIFDIVIQSLSYVSYTDACNSILIIAAREGYDDQLDLIVRYLKEEEEHKLSQHINCRDEFGRSLFMNIILREKSSNQLIYTKSLSFLNEYNEYFDIDAADSNGNTALHYAAQHDFILDGEEKLDQIFIKALIGKGACIDTMNKKGICVVDRLSSKMIENFLDDCIKESKDKNTKNYILAIDFKFMSTNNEPGFIRALKNSEAHHHLLYHPVITSYLHIRCEQVRYTILITPFFTFLFGLLTFVYMLVCKGHLMDHGFIDNEDEEYLAQLREEYGERRTMGVVCFEIIITIIGLFIMLREIIHLYIHKLRYFQCFRNYTKLLFLIITMVMLHTDNYGTQQRLMAWLFVIIPIGYLLIMERLHKRIAVYVHMLKRITIKYVKFIIFFLYPVGAFGITFYFSIKTNNTVQVIETIFANSTFSTKIINTEQVNKTRFADSTLESFLKTLTMSTGEFNFSDLDLEQSTGLIFFAFVFFVYLVCMNLLNGTAISEIQYILDDASKYYIRRQADCMLRFEDWNLKFIWIRKNISCVDRILNVFNFEYCFPDKVVKLYHDKDATADQTRYVRCNIKDHRMRTAKGTNSELGYRLIYITKYISWFTPYPANKDQSDVKCEEGLINQDQGGEYLDLQDCGLGHRYMIPSEYVAYAKQILDKKKINSIGVCSCGTNRSSQSLSLPIG